MGRRNLLGRVVALDPSDTVAGLVQGLIRARDLDESSLHWFSLLEH